MEIQLSAWLGWMACSLVLTYALWGISARRQGLFGWKTAVSAGLCGALLGAVCAKGTYYLCQIDFMIASGWWDSLISPDPEMLSFYGGAAGICLGTALAAKCGGCRPMDALNSFAPWGLLLGALVRFGEAFLGMLGVGPYLEDERLCFFPLAKGFSYGDDWTEWYLAVFMLEGICLLAVAVFSGRKLKENRFLRSLFWLCLPQILLENLRLGSFMWFFCIRVEQLACMVCMFVILIIYGVRGGGSVFSRMLPAGIALLCAGLFIVCEFAMEGKIVFLQFLTQEACYALMFLGQIVLAVTEIRAFRHAKAVSVRPEENK